MSPPASATPAPMSATNVTATTPNPAKFGTNDVKMKRTPSIVRRLWIGTVTSSMCQLSSYRRSSEPGSRIGCVASS